MVYFLVMSKIVVIGKLDSKMYGEVFPSLLFLEKFLENWFFLMFSRSHQ